VDDGGIHGDDPNSDKGADVSRSFVKRPQQGKGKRKMELTKLDVTKPGHSIYGRVERLNSMSEIL
jgi:hypothetical protein